MTRNLRSVAAAVLLAVVLGVSSSEAGEPPIDRLESLNRSLSSEAVWLADFQQEYIPAGMSLGDEAAGRVWLAWPDRALFHTGDPPVRLMGLQGRSVRLVDLGDRTCDEHQLSDREWERVPLAAVLDPRGALVHFDVTDHDGVDIVLTPKEPGGVDRVELVLGGDGLPREVLIRDPQGAVNRLTFTEWRAASEPPNGVWLPAVADDLECVTDRGAMD